MLPSKSGELGSLGQWVPKRIEEGCGEPSTMERPGVVDGQNFAVMRDVRSAVRGGSVGGLEEEEEEEEEEEWRWLRRCVL
jgi:hypothetical protein